LAVNTKFVADILGCCCHSFYTLPISHNTCKLAEIASAAAVTMAESCSSSTNSSEVALIMAIHMRALAPATHGEREGFDIDYVRAIIHEKLLSNQKSYAYL
jgi:hypothetical protein